MTARPAAVTAGYRPTRNLRLVASQPAGTYVTDPLLAGFNSGLDGLLGRSLDELDEPAIRVELGAVEQAIRRLQVRRARAVSVLSDRQARRAAEANPDDKVRARERAKRQVRNDLADEHGWTKGEAKDNERLGSALNGQPELADAAEDGDIPTANATQLGRFLERLSPAEKAKVEPRLLEAARTQDPVTFGRTIDQIRAELSPDNAEKAEAQRHGRRRASTTQTSDGMTRLFAELATADGAIVTRGLRAFGRPDAPGEYRRPEQRTADALVDMAKAALDDTGAKAAPSEHGVRPHVVVTIPIDVLLANQGTADMDGTQVPIGAIRHLMDDAGWSFIVTEAHNRPLKVTSESRTVPVALWRALQLRDGGCIVEGCDIPAGWCDVMHLNTAYRDNGRLNLDNAALGCRTHHTAYDNTYRYELHWGEDDKPVLRRRNSGNGHGGSPTRAGPAP